jgi:queuosine precursor transporter
MHEPPTEARAAGAGSLAFCVLAGVFSGSLVISAVLAAKLIAVGPLVVPAGVLAFSLTFLCTDVVNEIFGPRAAYRVVVGGFVALLITLGLIRLAVMWPPAGFWEHQEAYATILATSERVIVASVSAYAVSQSLDVWVFARLRRATQGRFLWLRNNASTALAQLVDSAVFVTIAFLGAAPVLPLVFGQWIIKLLIALLDTPVVYGAVWLLRARGAGTISG